MTDLTNPHGTAFGLLDEVYGPGTQDALRAHGGPYEFFDLSGKWREDRPLWRLSLAYRVAPQKPRRLIVKDWSMIRGNFAARDEDGRIFSYEQRPAQRRTNLIGSRWLVVEGDCWSLEGVTDALIDPGTCHWTEAFDCKDDPNNAKGV